MGRSGDFDASRFLSGIANRSRPRRRRRGGSSDAEDKGVRELRVEFEFAKKKKEKENGIAIYKFSEDFRTNFVGNVTASIESGSKRNFIYYFPFTFPNVNLKFK